MVSSVSIEMHMRERDTMYIGTNEMVTNFQPRCIQCNTAGYVTQFEDVYPIDCGQCPTVGQAIG